MWDKLDLEAERDMGHAARLVAAVGSRVKIRTQQQARSPAVAAI